MSTRLERLSTTELLRRARYHRAALKSHPATTQLAAGVAEAASQLRSAKSRTEEREEGESDCLAARAFATFDLDLEIRRVEYRVLGLVDKNRMATSYRAVFPIGLTALVERGGEEKPLAVDNMVSSLRARFTNVAEEHAGELERLARIANDAERAYKAADALVTAAFTEEKYFRSLLIERLLRNEGALLGISPGQKGRVRRFFHLGRKSTRRVIEHGTSNEPTQ